MDSHHHHHHSDLSDRGQKSLLVSSLLNGIITIAQIIGGLLSNSLSLLSDALHNLGDTLAIFIAYLARKFGNKTATPHKTFGYKRIEIIAALFNSATLIVISLFLFVEAFKRFADPEPIKGQLMLLVAIVGLLANLISVFLLNPHKKGSLNIKAAYLHLLGDTLSSVAVILGGIAITFWEQYWVDPVITIAVGLYLIIHTIKVLKQSVNILMQSSPETIKIEELAGFMVNLSPEIKNVHHIHIWTLDDKRIFLECHIQLNKNLSISDTEKISGLLRKKLEKQFSISHLTFQYEVYSDHPDSLIHQ